MKIYCQGTENRGFTLNPQIIYPNPQISVYQRKHWKDVHIQLVAIAKKRARYARWEGEGPLNPSRLKWQQNHFLACSDFKQHLTQKLSTRWPTRDRWAACHFLCLSALGHSWLRSSKWAVGQLPAGNVRSLPLHTPGEPPPSSKTASSSPLHPTFCLKAHR